MLNDDMELGSGIARLLQQANDPVILTAVPEPHLVELLRVSRALIWTLETLLRGMGAEGEAMHPVVRWRQLRGLTQSGLAAAVGISPAGMNRIEHRPGLACRPATRERIAATLGVPLEYLLPFSSPNAEVGTSEAADPTKQEEPSLSEPENQRIAVPGKGARAPTRAPSAQH